MVKYLYILFLFTAGIFDRCEESNIVTELDTITVIPQKYHQRAIELSKSGDAYQFMALRAYLGANNALLKKRIQNDIIEYQLQLIENILSASSVSMQIKNNRYLYKDIYKGWVSYRDNGTKNSEVPLYESYSFFYIAQFLYIIKNNGWVEESSENITRWNIILAFIEQNIWTKWYQRCVQVKGNHYWYFLRGRTHMGSHWAGIAMYLNKLSENEVIKSQTEVLVNQYDCLLKRNLKLKENGYVWNSTYDNVEGTYASAVSGDIIQDVSHGNHVVAYIIAAFELGNENWSKEDINRLCYTLTEFVYDSHNNRFKDNVDGSDDESRPGWGNFVGDGWVQLADYSEKVRSIIVEFQNSKQFQKYNQELQFTANLNKVLLP